MKNLFTLGIDFGTNSVRALVVRCSDGAELASSVANYPSGKEGILLDPKNHDLARQHPGDYLVSMEVAIADVIAIAQNKRGFSAEKIVGIGVDATSSSIIPVDRRNQALGTSPRWKKNLNAQCWLWKDHTSAPEAERITALAAKHRPEFIAQSGGTYSSEWFWAKIWHCFNVAPDVFAAADSWVELADWIPSVLASVDAPSTIVRGVCAAGHKAMYNDEWGGLPDKKFLRLLHPKIASLRDRLYSQATDASVPAGRLGHEWANKLGLNPGLPIAIGMIDVHAGAIGCGVAESVLVKIIGTSTCDCAVLAPGKKAPRIPKVSGAVKGSILPGYYGVEAGQSAVGDIFKWWAEGIGGGDAGHHAHLTAQAAALKPGQSGLLALDWNNGNRDILRDPRLTGLLIGQTLHTTSAEIYRALIEATAFGARVILEQLKRHGVSVERIVCAGGVAAKNPMLMQIYADISGCTLLLAESSQACALGAAICAAVVGGAHPDFPTAQRAMARIRSKSYRPKAANQKVYDALYIFYRLLHDAFGGTKTSADVSSIMKGLLAIKMSQSAEA